MIFLGDLGRAEFAMPGQQRQPGLLQRAGQVAAGAGAVGAAAIGIRNRKAIGYAAKNIFRKPGSIGQQAKRLGTRIGNTARRDIRAIRSAGTVGTRRRQAFTSGIKAMRPRSNQPTA